MDFLVIVTCAHMAACPLGNSSVKHTFAAASEHECNTKANQMLRSIAGMYGYNHHDFKVTCRLKRGE